MKNYYWLFYLYLGLLAVSCSTDQSTNIQGNINYTGSSEIILEEKPLHYKYADKIVHPIETDPKGNFGLTIRTNSTKVSFFTIDDQQYPVVLQPGVNLFLTVSRENFPVTVDVEGYPQSWDDRFSSYWKELQPIQTQIDKHLPEFRTGQPNSVPDLYKQRYLLAKKHLGDTPLDVYYYKSVGEYLVKKLESIMYRSEQQEVNPERERQKVIEIAKELDFFSYKSLNAQRAGIRDFTNAYANTFGVKARLEEEYGQELLQYDVNRLGYNTLDSARVSVLNHIEDRKALAYAKMHLVAERIGEMSPKVAEDSYRKYLQEFKDFPTYTGFLKNFFREVESVSPGNPAVPFRLPDQDGNMVNMKEFRGKFVLLDFWASWCIPCLDEFIHMKKLYNTYSRDQFEILAISTEEDSLRWRQALERFDNPWPQLYGGNGFQQETFQAYKGGGIPFYILIGPDGRIVRHNDIRPSFNLPGVLDSLITNNLKSHSGY